MHLIGPELNNKSHIVGAASTNLRAKSRVPQDDEGRAKRRERESREKIEEKRERGWDTEELQSKRKSQPARPGLIFLLTVPLVLHPQMRAGNRSTSRSALFLFHVVAS